MQLPLSTSRIVLIGAALIGIAACQDITSPTSANSTNVLNVPSAEYALAGTPGLVAAYSFDETSGTTVTDLSGNANTGTFGSGVTRTTAGRFGGALKFGGSGMVRIPSSTSLRLTTAMTLEAWVKPSTVSNAWRDLVYKGNDNYYLMASTDRSAHPGMGGKLGGSTVPTEAFAPTALTTGAWYHLAATYDGSMLRLYVNGTQVASTAKSGAITTSTNPLTIGGDPIYGQNFQGLIDEVRVYNRALSTSEVQADMNSGSGTTTTTVQSTDVTPPTVSISTPQASGTYTTTSTQIAMSGVAADSGGVTQVRWSNDRGGSGIFTGTTSWSASAIPLQSGTNIITVTAQDAANNVATTSLTVVSNVPAATATKLAITTQPSTSATSGVAFAQQPVVQLRDSANNAVGKSGVVVTAAIVSGGGTLGGTVSATTNASGVAMFTNLSISGVDGARTLGFSATGLTGAVSSSISVTTPTTTVTSGSCPNEPSTYARINEQPWDVVPVHPNTSLGWIDDYWNAGTAIPVVSDPTSPFPSTNHNVAAGTFPAGSPGGSSPFFIYRPFASTEQYKNIYICLYLKHSADFDNTNGNTGTKFLWPAADQVQGTQTYNGHDGANMDFQFFQQGAVDRRLGANLNTSAAQLYGKRGQWVRYEMLLKASSSNSSADGGLDVWIDGVQTHHYTNVQWQMSSARTWMSLGWNPTYGGGFNPVPHTQYQYMDHILISGSNQ